jgi:hypothetical protein
MRPFGNSGLRVDKKSPPDQDQLFGTLEMLFSMVGLRTAGVDLDQTDLKKSSWINSYGKA